MHMCAAAQAILFVRITTTVHNFHFERISGGSRRPGRHYPNQIHRFQSSPLQSILQGPCRQMYGYRVGLSDQNKYSSVCKLCQAFAQLLSFWADFAPIVIYTSYADTDPAAPCTSVRMEEPHPFWKIRMERYRFCHKKLTLCALQVLRGRGLDHEQREMSDKREITSAGMHYAILRLTVDSASGKTEETRSLSQKTCTKCNMFVKKKKEVPCCRRRNRLSGPARGWNRLHRVTWVI
jgi:hypothetical protein